MSGNYRFYATKMAQLRKARNASHRLEGQLRELFGLVAKLDAIWALEERAGRKYTVSGGRVES